MRRCPSRRGRHGSNARAFPAKNPLPAPLVLAAAFAAGSIPFSGIAAQVTAGVDLRASGAGTVSGTGLYRVSGFGPLAVAGSLDVAKGALGPLLAGRRRPGLAAVAAGLAVAGHNWSPWLRGAGGRGISPALGASIVLAPEGVIALGAGLGGGRLLRQSGLGTLIGSLLLFPLLSRRRGGLGALVATCIVAPMLAKRLLGNDPPDRARLVPTLVSRMLFDRDP